MVLENQAPELPGVSRADASAKMRLRPHPLLDYEVSGTADNEESIAAYAAAVGLPKEFSNAKSLPSSLNNKLWQTRSFAASMAEVLYEEASPQRQYSPQMPRKGRSLTDESLPFPLGRSPPLSPAGGVAPAGEDFVLHDALHVGPLDMASSFSADPAVVYVRLSNFAARRRGCLRLHPEKAIEEDELDLEPFSPVLHPCNGSFETRSFEAQISASESRMKRRRSRSGSEISQGSSTYGSSSNLQAIPGREISGDSAGMLEDFRQKSEPEESERFPPPNHLERCSTWVEGRRPTQEPEEEEEIASIQRHLEAMNAAAADLNAAQESLNACLKRQRSLIQLWAVVNARLARAVGSNHIAKAAPLHICQKRCKAAQAAVEEAGCTMMTASKEDMDELNEQYATRLQEFQDARKELAKLSAKNNAPSEATMAAVAPYFEAEEEHRGQLSEEESQEQVLRQVVVQAKARYHAALRSLESLSNQAHLRRAGSGVLDTVSRTSTDTERQGAAVKRSPSQTPEKPTASKVLLTGERRRWTPGHPSLRLKDGLGHNSEDLAEESEHEHDVPIS